MSYREHSAVVTASLSTHLCLHLSEDCSLQSDIHEAELDIYRAP